MIERRQTSMKRIITIVSFLLVLLMIVPYHSAAVYYDSSSFISSQNINQVLDAFFADYNSTASYCIDSIQELYAVGNSNVHYVCVDAEVDSYPMYFIIDSNSIIVEFAKSRSPFFSCSSEGKQLLYSPCQYFYKAKGDSEIFNLISNEQINENTIIDAKLKNKSSDKNHSAGQQKYNYPSSDYIINVPDNNITSTYGDLNTSMYNILKYWDENGFIDLVSNEASARSSIETCLNNNGGVYRIAFANAMDEYVGACNSNYIPASYCNFSPVFDDLRFEITRYYSPCVLGISLNYAHLTYNVTGVGYKIISNVNYAIIHDCCSSTAYDIYLEFSHVEFLGGFSIF